MTSARFYRQRAGLLAAMVLTGIATAVAGEIAPADRKSGYDFMSAQARAMQDDDTANPGMLSVLDGEASWNKKAGAGFPRGAREVLQ